MTIPYYDLHGDPDDPETVLIPPCHQYCHDVENQCPYFQPDPHTQYAGEPTFLCRGETNSIHCMYIRNMS